MQRTKETKMIAKLLDMFDIPVETKHLFNSRDSVTRQIALLHVLLFYSARRNKNIIIIWNNSFRFI